MPVEIIKKNYTQGLKLQSWVQHLFNVCANWSQKDNSLITAPYNQFQLTTLDPSKQMKIISVALWAQQIDLIKMNLLVTLHPESLIWLQTHLWVLVEINWDNNSAQEFKFIHLYLNRHLTFTVIENKTACRLSPGKCRLNILLLLWWR